MKIVKFSDGEYGVRRRVWWKLWVGFEFLDLTCGALWREMDSVYFRDCRGSYERAAKSLAMRDKGVPV
ncbi:hypothetical protein [Rhodanobacter lindaniclasticus]|uniref:hypothetical protein n=1 Tax=Rhodanobacter lindaniclasticus TaxID=75310 RepID=UPI0010A0BA5C|nr:hypothetical protein [Rhodanobacter lindaniclasticus]